MRTTIAIIQSGVPIARCELLDANAVRCVNRHDKLGLAEQPLLLMEFHGSAASVAEQSRTVQELAREHGGQAFEWATTPEERTRLWAARLAEFAIGVYEVRPGIIMTDMTAVVKEKYDKLIAQGLLLQPRWGLPEDVGAAVAMLVRGDIGYSTGQVICVDGGMTLPRL